MVFIPFHAQLISSFSLFLSKEKAKLNVQCYIIKIILMISDNLPKGKGEGQDNIMQNCIITSADLPKRCSALMGKGLDQHKSDVVVLSISCLQRDGGICVMRNSLRSFSQRRKRGWKTWLKYWKFKKVPITINQSCLFILSSSMTNKLHLNELHYYKYRRTKRAEQYLRCMCQSPNMFKKACHTIFNGEGILVEQLHEFYSRYLCQCEPNWYEQQSSLLICSQPDSAKTGIC